MGWGIDNITVPQPHDVFPVAWSFLLGYASRTIFSLWIKITPQLSPDTFRYKYQKYLGSPLIVPLWIGSMLLTWSSATSIYVNRLCGNLTFLLLLLKPAYNIGLIYTAPPPLTLIRIPSAQLFLMHLFNAECITKNHLIYYASQYTNLYGESNLFLSPST